MKVTVMESKAKIIERCLEILNSIFLVEYNWIIFLTWSEKVIKVFLNSKWVLTL